MGTMTYDLVGPTTPATAQKHDRCPICLGGYVLQLGATLRSSHLITALHHDKKFRQNDINGKKTTRKMVQGHHHQFHTDCRGARAGDQAILTCFQYFSS